MNLLAKLKDPRTNRKYIFIVVILGLVVSGAILSYCWLTTQQAPKVVELKIPEDKKIVAEDETANWKTYRNEEYGFEVKYPGDWEIDKRPIDPIVPKPVIAFNPIETLGDFGIYITESPGGKTIKEDLQALDTGKVGKEFKIGEQEEVELLGLLAIQREEILIGPRHSALATYLKKDNLIFKFWFFPTTFSLTITEKDRRLNDQILSTFRFIE